MSRVIIKPGFHLPPIRHGREVMEATSPDIVIRLSEPALFTICFCIAMAALLAILVLGCDKDGNFRAK
jgi:hypothetical protein